MNQQRISVAQRQLAQQDQRYAADRAKQVSQKIANVAIGIDRIQDPQQKNAAYQQALQQAAKDGADISAFPQQYDEQAQAILAHHKAQVYGEEILKADLNSKPVGPASEIGKLQADMDLLPEGDPRRAYYSDAIRKKTYIAPPSASAGSKDDRPASVQEYEYFNSLDDAGKEAWLKNKRGDRVSAGTEAAIIKSADTAQQENVKYVNYTDLAQRYQAMAATMPAGAAASVHEWMKEQTGSQDAISLLRKDWAAVKGSEVVSNLPPGAASDADVKMALAGFLPNNAKPEAVSAFLRGVAKLSKINGEYAEFKANYLSENKSSTGMFKAWKDHAKNNVPQGSTKSSGNVQQIGRFTVEKAD
jgi:hypothetical protein